MRIAMTPIGAGAARPSAGVILQVVARDKEEKKSDGAAA